MVEHGGGRFYVCREDETPARVAAAHGVATHALVLENRPLWGAALTSNARLELGTALRLPPKVSAARARARGGAQRGGARGGDGGEDGGEGGGEGGGGAPGQAREEEGEARREEGGGHRTSGGGADGLVVGAAVKAKFGGRGKFYPGKIEAVNADGTFVILFDDGDKEPIATREEIKLVVGEGGGPAVAAAIAGKRSLPEATEDNAEPPCGAAPASSAEAMQKLSLIHI